MDIRTRRQLVLLAVAAMMALAAVLALSARTSPPRFHELSNRGRQVDLQAIPPRERAWLAGQGYSTDVWLLGERGAMRFYLGAGQSSRVRCYITGIVTGGGERFDG